MSACAMRDAAVGWALHALEPEDEQAVLEHLAHCVACQRLHTQALEVAAALAVAVPALDPPPALRGQVLAAAHAERPALTALRDGLRAGSPTGPQSRGAAGRRLRGADRRRRRLTGLLAAALVAGIVLAGVRVVLATPSTAPAPTPTSTVAEQADHVIHDAETHDPSARPATLRGPDGAIRAVVIDGTGGPRLVPLALPPAGAHRDYVLWRVSGRDATAVAVYDPATGTTRPTTPTPASTPDPASTTGFAVSLEPAGPPPAQPSLVVARGTPA